MTRRVQLHRGGSCTGQAGQDRLAHYLATWFLWRLAGRDAAEEALAHVAPVGQESDYVSRAMGVVGEFIGESAQVRRFSVP